MCITSVGPIHHQTTGVGPIHHQTTEDSLAVSLTLSQPHAITLKGSLACKCTCCCTATEEINRHDRFNDHHSASRMEQTSHCLACISSIMHRHRFNSPDCPKSKMCSNRDMTLGEYAWLGSIMTDSLEPHQPN